MKLDTIPNDHPGTITLVRHRLALPSCCPVSGNPCPGSELVIEYFPKEATLEVYSLRKLVDSFKNGAPDGTRNMEAMIQRIHQIARETLPTVEVATKATIVLDNGDRMEVEVSF